MRDTSTICAISTPPGSGGMAVIRLSGPEALPVAESVFRSHARGVSLSGEPARTLHVGWITDGSREIDEVVVALFRGLHSYTGEDVVEISCHGSLYIQQRILELLISRGARIAAPGEFTQRAFLNGRMDLSQAEAVADLIASTNEAAHRIALHQMRGGFSAEIRHLREQLLRFTALVELELDFSEEDVEFADRVALKALTVEIEALLSRLAGSFRLGNAIKNGIPVVIAGETNVGKSTLLNALLNEEKAIVSDIHGTTRDVIEDVVNIHGTAFRFFDTAGIRETHDAIETMGIERTFSKLRQAEIVLLVVDLTSSWTAVLKLIEQIRGHIDRQHLIITANKADRQLAETAAALKALPLRENEDLVFLSAKSRENLGELIVRMQETLSANKVGAHEVIVSNLRHYEALVHAREAILRVQEGLEQQIPGDLLAQDIRECLWYLGSITGDISEDEVLGYIFKNFCIGK
ncbi:MAG TPA: tRNA uridine-5-carboxymethylaminomethyl(34) synthesis GTPase MnmE [Prolixibacteraceae bacterium]|nr:tRNA uridine-5-carboxymethylaminomethyl(34) synthesis GTPase MnmE [Prolixibacteraceae bacterium]